MINYVVSSEAAFFFLGIDAIPDAEKVKVCYR